MRKIPIFFGCIFQLWTSVAAQDAKSVIARYVEASGSKQQIDAISSTQLTLYTFRPGKDTSVVEETEALPHFSFSTHRKKDKVSLEYYKYSNGKGTFTYSKKLRHIVLQRQQFEIRKPSFSTAEHLTKMFEEGKLAFLGEQKLRGKSYFAFEVPTIRNTIAAKDVYYFDKQSGLLEVSRASNDSTILIYRDHYKTVSGITIPFTTTTTENDTVRFISMIKEFKTNIEVDTMMFYPPQLKSFREGDNRFQKIEYLKPEFGERTLEELLAHFAGKRILIDLWASWCVPCNAEFSVYDDKFYEFLFFNQTEILFISIDSPNKENKWKEVIDWFNVNGYHLRAGERLKESIRTQIFKGESLGKQGQFTIPRYILVDETGQILDDDVPKPSSQDFSQTLQKYFNHK